MLVFPNVKINIGLNITARCSDGFHDIQSIFYPVPWNDALEIVKAESFSFSQKGIVIEGEEEDNLCVKAYRLLQKEYGLPPVHIFLYKNIPTGAGLGGGSSDGAETLKLLNELFELKISAAQLENHAANLGSDCPFFIRNRPAYITGRGELIQEIAFNLQGYWIAIVYPGIHISTKAAFSEIKPHEPEFDLPTSIIQPIEAWGKSIKNNFEPYAFCTYPVLKKIKDTLIERGAIYASMSGSGSAIYGIFKEKPEIGGCYRDYTVNTTKL